MVKNEKDILYIGSNLKFGVRFSKESFRKVFRRYTVKKAYLRFIIGFVIASKSYFFRFLVC